MVNSTPTEVARPADPAPRWPPQPRGPLIDANHYNRASSPPADSAHRHLRSVPVAVPTKQRLHQRELEEGEAYAEAFFHQSTLRMFNRIRDYGVAVGPHPQDDLNGTGKENPPKTPDDELVFSLDE